MAIILLVSCASPPVSRHGLATSLPAEYLPTAAALTLQSGLNPKKSVSPATSQAPHTQTPTLEPAASGTPVPSNTASHTPPLVTLAPTFTATFLPVIPAARVQIYQPGELSRVGSPLKIFARLYSRVGKVVRVELHGEDGRLLGRELTTYHTLPWQMATIKMDMDFEISLPAELGRLVVSVEDRYGRLIDVNTVNLILLQYGDSELNPSSALQQAINILEPLPQTLIQGGTVFVSGLARPNNEDTLRIELISQDGLVLGYRLAAVEALTPGGYGAFTADVPYTVSQVTPALLVVYESGGVLSSLAHLAGVEVVLSP